jgi:hypothetical protein
MVEKFISNMLSKGVSFFERILGIFSFKVPKKG